MSNNTVTTFRTIVEETEHYVGESLSEAIRTWDAQTFNLGKSVPGGISVQTMAGDVMVRDGWVLHVTPSGVTYLNPNLSV